MIKIYRDILISDYSKDDVKNKLSISLLENQMLKSCTDNDIVTLEYMDDDLLSDPVLYVYIKNSLVIRTNLIGSNTMVYSRFILEFRSRVHVISVSNIYDSDSITYPRSHLDSKSLELLRLVKSITNNNPIDVLELYNDAIGGYFYLYVLGNSITTYLSDESYYIIIDTIFKYYNDFIISLNNYVHGGRYR